MSEQSKVEVSSNVSAEVEVLSNVSAEVNDETKVDDKQLEEIKQPDENDFSSIFINETDVFDIIIKFNKVDGALKVEFVDDDFIDENSKEIKITFKYPSQGDYDLINGYVSKSSKDDDDTFVRDFMKLELARVLVLIRKWSLKEKLSNDSIYKLHPKVFKCITYHVREKISTDGLL